MSTPTKPILYNGFKVNVGITVIGRIERVFFTEVYNLSNGSFLYLFTNLKIGEVRGKREQLIKIEASGSEYLGLITDSYSQERVTSVIDSLTQLKGFDAVAGMNDLKKLLIQDVIKPLLEPEKYEKFKLSVPNGILLYGPPGCGKTYIIRKLAEELSYNYVEVKHSDIASSYIHGTVGKVGRLFDMARQKAPSIIFIDEIEGIVPKRENIDTNSQYKQEEVNEFLMQIDAAGKSQVLVVAATNRPNLIDRALLRSGRMDMRIPVGPPDIDARIELFKLFFIDRPTKNIDYEKLAGATENYISSDIEFMSDQAARVAMNEGKEYIDEEIIERVIIKTPPTISKEEVDYYRQFSDMERW